MLHFDYSCRRLNDAAQKNRKSLAEAENSSDGDEIMPRSQSGISVRSRRSIPSLKSASKNSVDEESMLIAAELHDLPEGSESGDSETATEVDVSIYQLNTSIGRELNLIIYTKRIIYTFFISILPRCINRLRRRLQNSKSTRKVATN